MTDDELLNSTIPVRNYDYVPQKEHIRRDPLLAFIGDMFSHPMAYAGTVASMLSGNPAFMSWDIAEALSEVDPYSKKIGVRFGSPTEFIRYMEEHPGDWKHLFSIEDKIKDMQINPEDYPE